MPTHAARMDQAAPEREGVRDRLLKAAHELFTDLGYRATTTREIAARAQVAELTLFRHFGSKADIFEASVLTPLKDYINRWCHSWVNVSAECTLEQMANQLADGLYTLVRQDHRIFQELIAARSDPRSDLYAAAVAVSTELRKGLRAVHDASFIVANRYGLPADDKPATIGAVAAMIVGSVVLEDWVYPAQHRIPGRDRMVRELTRMIIDGTTHRDGA